MTYSFQNVSDPPLTIHVSLRM